MNAPYREPDTRDRYEEPKPKPPMKKQTFIFIHIAGAAITLIAAGSILDRISGTYPWTGAGVEFATCLIVAYFVISAIAATMHNVP